MNILKRPMFFAAASCSAISAISIFEKTIAFFIAIVTFILFLIFIIKKNKEYLIVLISVVLFTISLFAEFSKTDFINEHDGENLYGTFVVVEDPTGYDEYNTVVLKEKNCDYIPNGTKIFMFDYKKIKLRTGDIINASLKLSAIPKNNKYRLSNYGDGIYATANAKNIEKLNKTDFFYKLIGSIRSYVNNTVSSHFDGDSAGLLVAITTGDKSMLSDKFLSNVKTTGISHVIVVSGMHLSIVMAAIYFCIDKIFYNKYVRCALSVIIVLIIYSICGFTTSITRAGAMFIVASFAPIFSRDNDSLSSLLTAITAILIAAPFTIFNVSFLLSVLSTLAIIWIVPFYYKIINERFNIKSRFVKVVIGSMLCSIFAVIFTLPVIIKVFGYVSIVGAITNLIINFPIIITLILNIAALIIGAFPGVNYISYPIFLIADFCSQFTVFCVNQIAKLPVTVAVLPKSAFWWSVLIVTAVIGYMYYYEYKKKRSDFNAYNI